MPGVAPSHRPKFPTVFVDDALRIVRRRTVAHALWQRAALVLLLHNNPALSNVAAGEEVQLHPNTVRYWRKRWTRGDFVFHDAPRAGRPVTFSPTRPRRRESARL
jgi:hypothetical protein